MSMRSSISFLAAIAVCFAMPGLAGADTVISRSDAPIDWVETEGDLIVWPQPNTAGGGTTVMYRRGDLTGAFPIQRALDLGPGPDGHGLAVYSACAGPNEKDDCNVAVYDTVTGIEKPVPGAGTTKYREVEPTVWGNRVVFRRDCRSKCKHDARLAISYLDGTSGSRTLPRPPFPDASTGLELGAKQLVATEGCCSGMRIYRLRDGRSRRLGNEYESGNGVACTSDYSQSFFRGGYVYFGYTCEGDAAGYSRRNLKTGRTTFLAHAGCGGQGYGYDNSNAFAYYRGRIVSWTWTSKALAMIDGLKFKKTLYCER